MRTPNEAVVHTEPRVLETRAIDYVPWKERHGKVWHQGPFWFASNFVVLTMAVGFAGPLAGLGFGWSSIAAILGSAVGAFFMAFHANQGPRLGIPQMIQSRAQFGTRGSIIALVAALFVYVGFNVFDIPMATDGFHAIGAGGPRWLWYVGIVAFQAVIGIFGYDLIHFVQRWLTYVLIVIFAVLTIGAISALGGTRVLTMGHFNVVAFFAQFAAAAGYMIAYTIYVSDYTRYLPAKTRLRPLILWTYAGVVISAAWLMPLGSLFALEIKGGASVTSLLTAGNMIAPWFGTLVMGISSLALVTIMSVNTYGATLVLLTAIDGFYPIRSSARTRVVVTVVISLATLLAALVTPQRYETAFSSFLALILYFLVPWSAINLVDYYWIRHGRYSVVEIFSSTSLYGRWAWRGLVAYGVGFLVMVPFFALPTYVGPGARAFGGIDIAIAFGLPISGLVYYLLARTLDQSREKIACEQSLAILEP